MSRPLVAERQVEYWTSRQIDDFLWDVGYHCIAVPITQWSEKLVPADFVFAGDSRIKMFGLQYKVLYSGAEPYWRIDPNQHSNALLYPWLYYGLSDLQQATDSRAALHALRLAPPDKLTPPRCTPDSLRTKGPSYSRWWGFYKRLLSCKAGILIDSEPAFLNAFAPISDYLGEVREVGDILDIILLDLDRKHALKYSLAIQ